MIPIEVMLDDLPLGGLGSPLSALVQSISLDDGKYWCTLYHISIKFYVRMRMREGIVVINCYYCAQLLTQCKLWHS